MNLSETCIRRPVLTTLITASLIVFGAFAYRLLPVAALPAVDFPTIQITATLPGASPETMAASVASPIERQLSTISGISSMTSSSSLGLTQITDYAETVLAPQISQLPGVAQVLVYGAQKFAVRVQVDPVAAAARNISLDDVRTAVARANSSVPVGTLTGA